MEFAWVDEKTVQDTTEELISEVFREVMGVDLGEFPRIAHAEAMRRYGSDTPDLRYEMELVDVAEMVKGGEFKVFNDRARADDRSEERREGKGCVRTGRSGWSAGQ